MNMTIWRRRVRCSVLSTSEVAHCPRDRHIRVIHSCARRTAFPDSPLQLSARTEFFFRRVNSISPPLLDGQQNTCGLCCTTARSTHGHGVAPSWRSEVYLAATATTTATAESNSQHNEQD